MIQIDRNPLTTSHKLTINNEGGEKKLSDHITELNNVRPKQPFFFLKPSSSILVSGDGPFLRPKGVTAHYEVELGLVMGKKLVDFDESDEKGALDAIRGYLVAIDMTGRFVYFFSRFAVSTLFIGFL